MNAPESLQIPPALWQEARNAEGRVYYYNVQTKATQWTKPLELMTPVEVCILFLVPLFLNTADSSPARFGKSAMERIYCCGWAQVLV